MMRSWAPLAAIAAAALGGCVTQDADTDSLPGRSFEEREQLLRSVAHWEMRGRIAVDTGNDAWQGRFTWWQDADELRLLIRGPLNTRPIEIAGNGNELTVRTRRETRVLEDPETQLSELLGWWLPITSLPSWLLGLPDERYPTNTVVLDAAQLSALRQRAWELQYGAYELQNSVSIPGSIRLANEPLELVVTIDTWGPRSNPP